MTSTKETSDSALQAAYLKYHKALVSHCKKRGVDSKGFIPYMTVKGGADIMTSCSVCRLTFGSAPKTVKRHVTCDAHIDNIAACLRVDPSKFKGVALACSWCAQQIAGNRTDSLKRHQQTCRLNPDRKAQLPSRSYTTHDMPDRVSRQAPIRRSASLPIPTNSYAGQSSQHHYYNTVQATPAMYFDPFSTQNFNWN